jgi:hypothetical protein
MSFSAVFQFVPGDEQGMNRFLLEHYLEHQQFYKALLAETPPVVTVNLPIQRMDDPQEWLDAHQDVTQSVWTGLGGGQTTDFGRLDWDDHNMVQDWMQRHADWHRQVRDALGL